MQITGPCLEALPIPVTQAELEPLPFYERGDLLKTDKGDYIAAGDGKLCEAELILLDGTKEAIYRANEKAGLKLGRDTAVRYCKFFIDHVEVGVDFSIDLQWPGIKIEPMGDLFLILSRLTYKGDSYNVWFKVARTGECAMINSGHGWQYRAEF